MNAKAVGGVRPVRRGQGRNEKHSPALRKPINKWGKYSQVLDLIRLKKNLNVNIPAYYTKFLLCLSS